VFAPGDPLMLLDAGNTRLKWQLREDSRTREGCLSYSAVGSLMAMLRQASVEHIAVATVKDAGFQQRLVGQLQNDYELSFHFAKVEKQFMGLEVAYEHVQRLGVDRWLAMLGAWSQGFRNGFTVIDAGTAITVDFVDAQGHHSGGLIVPGIQAMAKSLLANTSAVTIKSLTLPQTWVPGCDTVACVEQGVTAALQGFMAEISSFSEAGKREATQILLTGGDAETLRPWLPASTQWLPRLVMDGLFYWLTQKENNK